ncbi:hypothetical protein P7K49_038162, partial [Saguinus oedipus]
RGGGSPQSASAPAVFPGGKLLPLDPRGPRGPGPATSPRQAPCLEPYLDGPWLGSGRPGGWLLG